MSDSVRHGRIEKAASDREVIGVLAQAASSSPLPTIIAEHPEEGHRVTFANDAYLAMSGSRRDAVVGRPVLPLLRDAVDGADLAGIEAALAEGRSGQWSMRLGRGRSRTASGMIYLTGIAGPQGRIVGHSINIVDLACAACPANEREMIYNAIYDRAPGFIAIARGPELRFEYTNASFRAFVKREDLIGKTVAETLPEIAGDGIFDLLDEVYRTGRPFRGKGMPVTIRDPATGCLGRHWIDVLYQPVSDEDGAVIGLFCEGYDVTDLHETNEALAALEMAMIHVSRVNAMGTMAATLAHELNQPLTAIANYLAGVRPVAGKTPDVHRLTAALDGIREASERASGIIDHLRQLIRHRKPSREPFNLREAVAECVRLVGSSCRIAIAFDNRVAADLVMTADRVMIQQVLINLVQNACDAMVQSERAEVTIDAVKDDRGITVSVADTGPGVSPEAIETMFSWTQSAKDDGMGIGLSICRTIVELYRGSIWLEKSGPQGSEFRFRLPAAREEAPEDEATAAPRP